MDNIFVETTLNTKFKLNSRHLNRNLNNTLLNKLKDKYEKKCLPSYGYIKENSIEIIKRDIGTISKGDLNGDIIYNIYFKAIICNPVNGNIISAKVEDISKLGLLLKYENDLPIDIIVPREIHEDKSVFENIKIDDIISISVLGKKFDSYSITIVGKIVDKTKIKYKELEIKQKNIKNKKQDTDFLENINTDNNQPTPSELGEEEEKGVIAEDTSFDLMEEEGLDEQEMLQEVDEIGEDEEETNVEFNEDDEFDYT